MTPDMYKKMTEILKKDEELYSYINSLIDDGGRIVGNIDFGSDEKNVSFLACKLSVDNPNKQIIIMKCDDEKFSINADSFKSVSRVWKAKIKVSDISLISFRDMLKVFYPDFAHLCFAEK